MIPVTRVPEPPDFKEKAGEPGREWLVSHPDAPRPRDFWTSFKPALADGKGKLLVVDASDPNQPTKAGHLEVGSDLRCVDLAGPHAFVCDHAGGWYPVDITDPTAPSEVPMHVYHSNPTENLVAHVRE